MGGGFGGADDDDDDEDEEESEGDPEDYVQDDDYDEDGVDEALRGGFGARFGGEEEDGVHGDGEGEGD